MEQSDRARRVLAALVREHIASGEPVPSSHLVGAVDVSSATVRNILAKLEQEGYVVQPHTSAGRIPTDQGYRFYVNQVLEGRPSGRAASSVEAQIRNAAPLIDSVFSQASHVVSQASGHVGFALRTARESAVFDRVEFVTLGASRVLVVIVSRGGHVLQKVIDTGESLDPDQLHQAAAYLNGEFSGLPLHLAREAVLERMQEERLLYDELMARAMSLASSTFSDLPEHRALYIDGAASLVVADQGLTLGMLQALLVLMEEKQRLVLLLNEYIDGPGLTVVIGAEHLDPGLRPFSLVASTYDDGGGTGTVGLIGPTRMRYPRAIAVVDGAARAVSRVLSEPD